MAAGDFAFETEDCVDFGDSVCDGTVEEISSMSAAVSHPRCARHADIYIRNAGLEVDGIPLMAWLSNRDRRRNSRL